MPRNRQALAHVADDGEIMFLIDKRKANSVVRLPTAMARANAGERIDELLDEIAELQRLIDTSPAETLEDAAVKLRRLGA